MRKTVHAVNQNEPPALSPASQAAMDRFDRYVTAAQNTGNKRPGESYADYRQRRSDELDALLAAGPQPLNPGDAA